MLPKRIQNGTTEAMATLTIKNVPDTLYAALKATAAANRRSINAEAIRSLETVLVGRRPTLEEIDKWRQEIARHHPDLHLTPEMIEDAIQDGRD